MQNLLEHIHLPTRAERFLAGLLEACPSVVRERELHWQLKMLSRYAAERDFFESCLAHKSEELQLLMPNLKIARLPPVHSTPLRLWSAERLSWPEPVSFLTHLFLQQILNSSDLFLDLGSASDSFFYIAAQEQVVWVPESRGTRWHEQFRQELARLYLGWAFEQEKLVENALLALHLAPLKQEVMHILSAWRTHVPQSSKRTEENFAELFMKAEVLGMHLHPNMLVWALYEIEMSQVLESLGMQPDLESSADYLCRTQSRISA